MIEIRLKPDEVIRDVHMLAEEMGFRRVRVDRSQYEDGPYIEVGYGCGEITVRTSNPRLRLRTEVNRIEMDDVIELIESLLDTEETS